LTKDTLSMIKERLDEAVGFISITTYVREGRYTDTATGFRVGEQYMMTAYHVFREKIGKISVRSKYINLDYFNIYTCDFIPSKFYFIYNCIDYMIINYVYNV